MENYTISEMKKLNESVEHGWFDDGAMEFFNTMIETKPKENYFITSERMELEHPKKYAIRLFDKQTYKVSTIGVMQQYNTLKEAEQALENILKGGN